MNAWLIIVALASPDVATVEGARELIRTARYQEALDTLRPIAQDPDRAEALAPEVRVVLYYALGRAHQELNQGCRARDAFDRALGQPTLEEPQRVRITQRREALKPTLTGTLTVDCVGAAVVGNSPVPCGQPQRMRAGTHAVTVSLSNGLAYPTEPVRVPACGETRHIAREPGTLRYVGPPAQVTVDDVAVTLDDGAAPVPPGSREVRVESGEKVLLERRVDFAPGVESLVTPPSAPVAVAPQQSSAPFWTAATVGGLSLVGAGVLVVFAADAADQHAALQRTYDVGRAGTDFDGLRAQMQSQEDEANRLYLVSGALAGVALVSGVIALWVYPSAPVSVGASPQGVTIGGAF